MADACVGDGIAGATLTVDESGNVVPISFGGGAGDAKNYIISSKPSPKLKPKLKIVLPSSVSEPKTSDVGEVSISLIDYSKKTREELIAICKENSIKGYSGKKKEDIIKLLSHLQIEKNIQTTVIHLTPLVKWSGGKSDEIKQILPHIPHYETYVEPFVGGGALYFYLNPTKAVINDIHPELIKLYKAIGSGNRKTIKQFMTDHANSEPEYYKVRNIVPSNDIEAAAQFYYLRKTCFRGMLRYNSQGKFNIPYGKYRTINYSDLDNPAYEQLLGRTTISNVSFKTIFEECNTPEHFIFLDPPYDSKFTDYGYCSFGKKEHEELASLFKTSKSKCLMVIGETDFIKELYKDYIVGRFPKNYKFKIHSGRVGDEINVNHIIIRNYSL